jgi:hypothetical protein
MINAVNEIVELSAHCSSKFGRFADFRTKMAIFRRAGMKEGGLPLPLAFQYLIFMI